MKNFVRIDSELNNFNSVVNIPGDKSISIRWILLASQAIGSSRAYNLLESDDIRNTMALAWAKAWHGHRHGHEII